MKRGSKIEAGEKEAEENDRGEKSWPSLELTRDRFSRYSLVHITAILSSSFSLPLPLFPPHRLPELLAETERRTAAAAAVETSTLLGCRSCGTGLRELPLEELHSPCVLPRLHVTHIYLRLSMPLLHGRSLRVCIDVHTHTYTHA